MGLGSLLQEGAIKAVIGPGCSSACETTASLTAGQNLAQISYGCEGPDIANEKQNTISRTVSPIVDRSPVVLKLLQYNKWTRAIMLTSVVDMYVRTGIRVSKDLQAAGIDIHKLAPVDSRQADCRSALSEIQHTGFRMHTHVDV